MIDWDYLLSLPYELPLVLYFDAEGHVGLRDEVLS